MDLRGRVRELVEGTPRECLPELVGALAEAQALVQLRLHENGAAPPEEAPAAPDRLLDAHDAGEMMGVGTRWLYDRADTLPFTRRLGPRTLRFSEAGIRRWLETRR